MSFKPQTDRIKAKLELAKNADTKFQVFGAASHKYILKQPLEEKEIFDFENEFNVSLPGSYRAFLTEIGNGGISYSDSAAGPYYGIFPLGSQLGFLVNPPHDYLSLPCSISPGMTIEFWDEHTKRLFHDDDTSDDEYHNEMSRVYGGLMPIGSQGCSFIHTLVLNGKHKGKVVNLDASGQKPQFTFDKHFLDWYERWLDEIISGHLITSRQVWFGYSLWRSGR